MLNNSADSSDSEFFCCSRLTISLLKRIYQKALSQCLDLQHHNSTHYVGLENPGTGNPGTSLEALEHPEGIERKQVWLQW
jgi:hypothetical protein